MNNVVLKGKLGAGFNDDRYTLPKDGNAGDILVKTETGSEWQKQEPATSTPDWNQNDSTASDYIKNRPGLYTSVERITVYDESLINMQKMNDVFCSATIGKILPDDIAGIGSKVDAIFDNVEYRTDVVETESYVAFGNIDIIVSSESNGIPFVYVFTKGDKTGNLIAINYTTLTHSFSVSVNKETYNKIDKRYLPEEAYVQSDWEECDSTSLSYIKNRISYVSKSTSVTSAGENERITAGSAYISYTSSGDLHFAPEKKYIVKGKIACAMSGIAHDLDSLPEVDVYKVCECTTDNELRLNIESKRVTSDPYLIFKSIFDGDHPFHNSNFGVSLHGGSSTAYSFDFNINLEISEIKIMPDVLIPDTIQRVGDDVIIPSSTSGSTKKFKITVDDSGTISASEVTT